MLSGCNNAKNYKDTESWVYFTHVLLLVNGHSRVFAIMVSFEDLTNIFYHKSWAYDPGTNSWKRSKRSSAPLFCWCRMFRHREFYMCNNHPAIRWARVPLENSCSSTSSGSEGSQGYLGMLGDKNRQCIQVIESFILVDMKTFWKIYNM